MAQGVRVSGAGGRVPQTLPAARRTTRAARRQGTVGCPLPEDVAARPEGPDRQEDQELCGRRCVPPSTVPDLFSGRRPSAASEPALGGGRHGSCRFTGGRGTAVRRLPPYLVNRRRVAAQRGGWAAGGGQGVVMSERRFRRRGRSPVVGVPVGLVGPGAVSEGRPAGPVPGRARSRTAAPGVGGAAGTGAGVPVASGGCCAAVRSREAREGGGVIVWTRHAAGCPVRSAR